jgi:hypothetical protein
MIIWWDRIKIIMSVSKNICTEFSNAFHSLSCWKWILVSFFLISSFICVGNLQHFCVVPRCINTKIMIIYIYIVMNMYDYCGFRVSWFIYTTITMVLQLFTINEYRFIVPCWCTPSLLLKSSLVSTVLRVRDVLDHCPYFTEVRCHALHNWQASLSCLLVALKFTAICHLHYVVYFWLAG